MSEHKVHGRKAPRFLDDITYTVADSFKDQDDIFSSDFFLGKYSESRIMELLDRVGILAILHARGYRDLIITINNQEDYTSRLYLNFERVEKETRLVELILRQGIFKPKEQFVEGWDFSDGLSMLLIEWLALQDPKAAFTDERPRLPGQVYPGLGGLRAVHDLLSVFARSGRHDALVDVPEYYHAAAIYSPHYYFFSPQAAGEIKAMMRDLDAFRLADVSSAIDAGCLMEAESGAAITWRPSEQIAPISKKMQAYVIDDSYRRLVSQRARECRYAIDWDKYNQIKKAVDGN